MDQKNFFGLRFEQRYDGATSPHVLPAQNLIQALDGLQRAIHLVAMMKEGREIRARARVTRDIEDRFQLRCGLSREGSFYQPTFIAERDQTLFSSGEIDQVAEITRSLLDSISVESGQEFNKTVVDSAFRSPLLAALDKIFSGQKGYRLDIEDRDGNVIIDSVTAAESLEYIRQSRLPSGVHSIVTGYLNKIDFKEHRLTLLLPETGRLLSCIYDEDIEPQLLENARDLIQVVGTIELDDSGNPQRITDVQEVHPVNTSDIDIVDLLPEYLKPREVNSLRVNVELSEDKQTYFARLDELGIDHAAYTRADLIDGLQAEIDFLWRNIAQEQSENLTAKAFALKAELLRLFKEINE